MSIKEQLHQKIEMMSPERIEWLNSILEPQEYPDVRVERSPEEMQEIKALLSELAAPMTTEEKNLFNAAMKR